MRNLDATITAGAMKLNELPAIAELLEQEFKGKLKADLSNLRERESLRIERVARQEGMPVGYGAITPVKLDGRRSMECLLMAPLMVSRDIRRGGVGTMLAQALIRSVPRARVRTIVAMGQGEFLLRLGFSPDPGFTLKDHGGTQMWSMHLSEHPITSGHIEPNPALWSLLNL